MVSATDGNVMFTALPLKHEPVEESRHAVPPGQVSSAEGRYGMWNVRVSEAIKSPGDPSTLTPYTARLMGTSNVAPGVVAQDGPDPDSQPHELIVTVTLGL